ncbi:MAG: DUF975 family protein [Lachnospiraceae bacterium]|nr:DUF975 family protein [Lachnospiraceae bacterium]
MFDRREIKRDARGVLRDNYALAIVGILIGTMMIPVFSTLSSTFSIVGDIMEPLGRNNVFSFVSKWDNPLTICNTIVSCIFGPGVALFSYKMYIKKNPQISDIFVTFTSGNFWRMVGGMLLMYIKIGLWTLLLVVPGIVKALEYSMVPYILVEQPELSIKECFAESRMLTSGCKGEIFSMLLSFVGWFLLDSLTFGILSILYVVPYLKISMAGVYASLRGVDPGDASAVSTEETRVTEEAEVIEKAEL